MVKIATSKEDLFQLVESTKVNLDLTNTWRFMELNLSRGLKGRTKMTIMDLWKEVFMAKRLLVLDLADKAIKLKM